MKKSFPANINGTVYYIDEDAYQLLDRYLKELHHTFTGETGAEIVADIESRISEHFDEKGSPVVVMADVERIISVIGRPEQLGEEADEPSASFNSFSEPAPPPPPYVEADPASAKRHLYRDPQDAIFAGVFAGLSYYLGWNVTAMRILYVVLTLCTYFWPLVCLYFVSWMLIPPARTPRQILEMKGEPVNLDTIGQTLVNGVKTHVTSGATVFFRSLGRIVVALIGGLAAIGVFGFAVLLLLVLVSLVLALCGVTSSLLTAFSMGGDDVSVGGMFFLLSVAIAALIPLVGLTYGGCMALFNSPAPSRTTVITLIVIEVIAITAAIVLFASTLFPSPFIASLVFGPAVTNMC